MIFGNKYLQFLFTFLFKISLKGMNIGRGSNFNKSGELYIVKLLKEKFENKNDIIVFDVGANIGGYTVEVCNILKEKVIVHAFEPSVFTFKNLKKNTESLKNVRINNFGLSSKLSKQTLYSNKTGSSLASIYQRNLDHFNIEMNQKEEILLDTLDNYCNKEQIALIDFLKLDIEGHELDALKGASKLLSEGKIKAIQFEFGGSNIDSKTYFRDFYNLLEKQYKIYRILSNGLIEITKYDERNEIFTTANYLCILKDSTLN